MLRLKQNIEEFYSNMAGETRRQPAKTIELSQESARIPAILLISASALAGIVFAAIVMFSGNRNSVVNTPPSDPVITMINRLAPDFEREDLNGETIRLSDFRGQMVILNFWATWCEPCRREMPAFQEFIETRTDDDPIILTVNMSETPEAVRSFYKEIGVQDIPTLIDPDSELQRVYGVLNLPTTFIVDKEGVIRALKLGEMKFEDLRAYREAFAEGV